MNAIFASRNMMWIVDVDELNSDGNIICDNNRDDN